MKTFWAFKNSLGTNDDEIIGTDKRKLLLPFGIQHPLAMLSFATFHQDGHQTTL